MEIIKHLRRISDFIIKKNKSMVKGRNYIMESKDFQFEFTYGRTLKNKIIADNGILICDQKELNKLNVKIYEKK